MKSRLADMEKDLIFPWTRFVNNQNFLNLVESWDGYILNFPSNPATTTHLEKYGMTSASTANFDYNFNYNL